METISSIDIMRSWTKKQRQQGKSIGLVPTMGYLHPGHLELMKKAKEDCDLVVVSIFVNPLQFGVGEDYEEYPRDLSRDEELALQVGVDAIFAPAVKEMYPSPHLTFVEVETITEALCGKSRPGHFKGVTTVVAKLFNCVQPDKAYFGQKDAQQVLVIEQMVRDLNMPLEIITAPIVREEDGLAMSSRNVNLNAKERKDAVIIYESLELAKEMIEGGARRASEIRKAITDKIDTVPTAEIDYVEILDCKSLNSIEELEDKILIALAVKFGNSRLIDNIMLEVS